MAARTDLGAITGNPVLDTAGASTIVFNAVNITAGSLAIVGGRYEGGFGSDVMTAISDTAGGTWAFYEFSDNPRAWIGVSYNHPGGTGVVITATLGGNRGYRESYGRLWSGTVGESDPVRVSGTAEFTSTDASGGTFTLTRTTGGDGMIIGIMASYGSLASPLSTTNGSELGTRATPTSYGTLVYKTHTGSSSQSLTGTGGNGLSNGIALEILEPGGGGGLSGTATESAAASDTTSGTMAATGTVAETASAADTVSATLEFAVVSSAFKNNTGTVLANLTDVTVWVNAVESGALVVKKTAQTTNASGVCTVRDAAIASATSYAVRYRDEVGGGQGFEVVTSS